MDIRNKGVRAELVRQTMETEGWGIIQEEIVDMMINAKDKMLVVSTDEMCEVIRLQERYRTLDRFIKIIIDITKEV